MQCHLNARLAPRGRAEVFLAVEAGMTVVAACQAFRVSRRWYYRWLPRWRASREEGLFDRSSRPRRFPRQLPAAELVRIAELRIGKGWGPDRIASWLGLHRSTVHRAIVRLGLLTEKARPEPAQRYEHARPGGLLHIDIKKLGRLGTVPGHRATGDRSSQKRVATKGQGWEYLHVAIDDCTRLVYCEILDSEAQAAATGFLLRAYHWFAEQGIHAQRLLTDNGSCFRARRYARYCRRLALKHIFTRPYRPQTNGKVERWIRTVLAEALYLEVFHSGSDRLAALHRYVLYYNDQRPHLGLSGSTPRRRLIERMAA